ncbi:MAG TPA: ABC transporter permease [Terracidiphilus sp.]|nr:ABC transporter permease [Terracidiphilus sp.]
MSWIPAIFRRRKLFEDLNEEMRLHIEERVEQLVSEGSSHQEAEQAARRAFGNLTVLEERSREVWQWTTLESIWADVRYSLRQLKKSPGFSFTVILSLTVGLGANTTIFTFVNALLLRPPAVADGGQLIEVMTHNAKASGIEAYSNLSYPGYVDLRDHNRSLSGFAAFDGDPHVVSWSHGGGGQIVYGQLVSSNLFSVLGVEPALGRFFQPDEGKGGAPTVVISHSFWQRELGGDRSVLGRVLVLNGGSYTVIGVAPESFAGVIIGLRHDFWTTLAMTPTLIHDPTLMGSKNSHWLFGVGRLKPGVSRSEAQADLTVLIRNAYASDPNAAGMDAIATPLEIVPGPFRGYVAAFTGLLMAAVGLVLLIACANAANLVLARTATRRRELAVRSALGASRFRIIRQGLTECLMLSMIGGAGGLLVAYWSIPELLSLKPATIPVSIDAPLDWHVLTFAFVASLLSGIAFGVIPVLRSTRRGLIPALKDDRQIAGPRRSQLRGSIVIAQITVCLVLLISAGLCVRSLFNARSIDPGFSTHDIAVARLDPGSLGYTQAQDRQFYQELLERVRALPGLSSASLSDYLPLGTSRTVHCIHIQGVNPPPGEDFIPLQVASVAPDYFKTMGTPVLAGREFSAQDIQPNSGKVIVNQAMATHYWPGQNPIGQHFKDDKQTVEIVGVVKTGKYRSLGEDPLDFMYLPLRSQPQEFLVVRTRTGEEAALGEIRHVIQSLDPNVVPMEMETISQYMALPLFAAHTTGVLLAVFGCVALLLATVGLSGTVSYSVSQRTNEIGVRMALGADRRGVVRLILKQGMRLSGIGILIGLAMSFAATRLLAGLLYGIKADDPLTFVSVALFLGSVALISCYLPARRAASIDPMKSLRAE